MISQSVHRINILVLFLFFVAAASVPFATGQAAAAPPISRPYGLNTEFNPSMAIFIVALISAFFFLGFFLIYLRQCTSDRRNGGSVRPTNGAGGRSRRGKRGLDPDVIQTFPIINYSDVKGLKIGKGALECAVCLNEFEDDETLRLLPKCDHVFHPECIDAWLVAHVTCPVCRANLKPETPMDVIIATDDVAAAREVSDTDVEADERNNEASEVTISVMDGQDPQSEVINPDQIPIQNGSVRLRPSIDGRFPRSHSTGHSLIQPGENCERFTLRLPDDVRKRIVNGRLNRTTSCLAFPIEDGSVSGGRGGEGSSRGKSIRFGRVDRNLKSDRWIFSMAPPFFTRSSSVKSQKVTNGDGSVGGGSTSSSVFPRGLHNSVKSPLPLECLGAKGQRSTDVSNGENGRPPV